MGGVLSGFMIYRAILPINRPVVASSVSFLTHRMSGLLPFNLVDVTTSPILRCPVEQ
jgi:hypothetical protein